MKAFLSFFFFLSTQSLLAGPFLGETLFSTETEVTGRLLSHSCSYYSNTEANLRVLFKSGPVDYGTRVFLEYGWERKDLSSGEIGPWQNRTDVEMIKEDAGTWKLDLDQIVAERSSPLVLTGLQFVFRVEEPGKKPRYHGGPEAHDSYIAHLPQLESATCVGPNRPNPDFEPLVVQIVRP